MIETPEMGCWSRLLDKIAEMHDYDHVAYRLANDGRMNALTKTRRTRYRTDAPLPYRMADSMRHDKDGTCCYNNLALR